MYIEKKINDRKLGIWKGGRGDGRLWEIIEGRGRDWRR